MQVHVAKESNIPDHCRTYALSDPNDKDSQSICAHDQLENFDRCELLASVLDDIGQAVQKMPGSNIRRDINEELTFVEIQAKHAAHFRLESTSPSLYQPRRGKV